MYYKSGSTNETIKADMVLVSDFKLFVNWELSIDLKVKGPANVWSCILAVRKKGVQFGQYGSRVPSLVLTPHGQLEVSASFSGIWNWYWNNPRTSFETWFNLKLRHNQEGKFQIYIDHVLNVEYVNGIPQEWENMEVILGDTFSADETTNAEYRNLLYQGFPFLDELQFPDESKLTQN